MLRVCCAGVGGPLGGVSGWFVSRLAFPSFARQFLIMPNYVLKIDMRVLDGWGGLGIGRISWLLREAEQI